MTRHARDEIASGAESADFGSSELLDAGLRAAYGDTGHDRGDSIVATLERTLGVRSILLRDDDDRAEPLVMPRSDHVPVPGGSVGRYQIAGEIARGGVGVILRGRDIDLGRDVAMKVLLDAHAGRAGMVQRFMEEAQITGQLQHPGVLPVYELGLDPQHRPFFTMKLVKGRTLAALLAEREHPSHERRRYLAIFEHVCQTLAYAHNRGVVHRDLKPSNVMVGAFGEVQVLDWGLAKVLPQAGLDNEVQADRALAAADDVHSQVIIETVRSGDSSAQSIAGALMGTPAYMPPEQARGEVQRLDERCDVFALGAILCEILTGRPPYAGSRGDVIRMASECRTDDAIQRLRACGADDDLVKLAEACLAAAPQARPRSAAAVASAVNTHLAGLEEKARALEISAAEARAKAQEERRARRLTTALATAVMFAILLMAGGWMWTHEQRQQRGADAARVVNAAMGSVQAALGRARASQIVDHAAWDAADDAGGQLRDLLDNPDLDDDTRRRADALLAELDAAARDRRLLERIENVVIVGATHQDAESWMWMDDQLIEAFRDYGIDLLALPPDEIARRIRSSDLSVELASGLELWIGTGGDLRGRFGIQRYTEAQMRERLEALYEADPDEYRVKLRKMTYAGRPPELAELRELAGARPFDAVSPVTLSWLGMAFAMAGDLAGCDDVYRRALLVHPDDLILNYDYAFCMVHQQRWHEAIRQYERCLVVRPKTGGIWRSLGIALRETGDLAGSRRAFEQSLACQPGHAPTHVDLGVTLLRQDAFESAIGAFSEALQLKPGLAAARAWRGRALHLLRRFDEALADYEAAAEIVKKDPMWREPLDAWIEACRQRTLEPAAPVTREGESPPDSDTRKDERKPPNSSHNAAGE